VILTTIWWWQKLGRDWQRINKDRSDSVCKGSISRTETKYKAKNVTYCVEISNRFAALEDLDSEVEINNVWETIRNNNKISVKDSIV
jgi:hypothetical protein